MEYQISAAVISRPLAQTFDYRLSLPEGAPAPKTGARAAVPLGSTRGNVAVIVKVQAQPAAAQALKLKEAVLLDTDGALLPDDIQALCSFASVYYHYPLGQCFFTALPALLREGRAAAFKETPALECVPGAAADRLKSSTLKGLHQVLSEAGAPLTRQELKDRGFNAAAMRSLIKKGLAREVRLSAMGRTPWQERVKNVLKNPGLKLNAEQQAAVDSVTQCLGRFQTFLLSGVTGSGKTEVYLQVIAKVLERGQAALVLVPEIALTPQTVERFYQRFAAPVVLMHSALTDAERLNAYLTMRAGQGAVLIGTRSALFTPIPHLGLIVIDEEHDSSFKQGDGLRYHARSLAVKRAALNACPIILGSATPALESVHNALTGRWRLLELTQRAGSAKPPEFEVVDLRLEPLSEGLKTGIGRTLEDAVGEETARGNQVLLFLNRRGYAHQLLCHHCGLVFTCRHCDSALTVHREEGRLKCHICGSSEPLPERCPRCGAQELFENGFGTEQAEAFLRLRYPDLGIERIDRDSIKDKSDLDARLERVRSKESMILIGTQMLAKGHDFPEVTLVGIIDIDAGLFSDDFRAPEFTAQLLTQVAGRAGRALKHGRVIVQTHHPDNLLLDEIIDPAMPYLTLAQQLLDQRAALGLPPYSAQAFLLANSLQREKAHLFLLDLLQALNAALPQFPALSLGPVMSDKIEKRHSRYHFHVQVLAPTRAMLSAFLTLTEQAARTVKSSENVRFAIDVDPLTLY